jgi:hypothetical protein
MTNEQEIMLPWTMINPLPLVVFIQSTEQR